MSESLSKEERARRRSLALNSAFARIPQLDVDTIYALLQLGYRNVHDLAGRCPVALFDEMKTVFEDVPDERKPKLRMAVYFAETPEPDMDLLHPWKWED